MAQNVELRVQSSPVSTPATGVWTIYVNSSGTLLIKDSAGNVHEAALRRTGSITSLNTTVPTGGAPVPVNTGTLYLPYITCHAGSSGSYMGQPTNWLIFQDPSGTNLAVPGYSF